MDVNQLLMTDKIAVVTGAAQGIGQATALALADLGAHVAVCDLLPLDDTVAAIEAKGRRAVAEVMDVERTLWSSRSWSARRPSSARSTYW